MKKKVEKNLWEKYCSICWGSGLNPEFEFGEEQDKCKHCLGTGKLLTKKNVEQGRMVYDD